MKIKIEIKHYLTGEVLFEYEKENNTLKDTLIKGVKNGAYLRGAKNIPYIPLCPSDGAFIGWKKISNYKESYKGDYLVKLEIPEDARRCSATTCKCRCDKARVLEITRIKDGEGLDVITNTNYGECVYKVGEMVISDSFDENRWNECSNGIHFFINKQQSIDY